MGFNTRRLPELKELIKIRENYNSDKEFLDFYVGKADAVIGPVDSSDYLEKLAKRVKKDEKRMGR
jgi:hypothetical protein